MKTKADIINDAYSQLRISGLTVNALPEEVTLALSRLESMMHELSARNICTSYNFEDAPLSSSLVNTEPYTYQMMSTNLALRLMPDFNANPSPMLISQANSSLSTVSAVSARDLARETQYPRRMPRGSGSTLRFNRWQRFYRDPQQAPQSCDTNNIIVGDINDYTEHFDAYLKNGEFIDTYQISSDSGLVIQSSSNTDEDVNYRIKSEKPQDSSSGFRQVEIVVTTTDGRQETRYIDFNIQSFNQVV